MAAPARLSSVPAEPASAARRQAELQELGGAFRRAFRAVSRLRGRDTHLAAGELSHAQFQLLIELHERGELPTGELAAAADLAPGTVTQMLAALVARGHVERARSGADRRVVVTRLTPLGRRAIEVKREVWQARWEAALRGVGERELRAAAIVLTRLAGMFEQVGGEACAGRAQTPAPTPPRGRKTPRETERPLL